MLLDGDRSEKLLVDNEWEELANGIDGNGSAENLEWIEV